MWRPNASRRDGVDGSSSDDESSSSRIWSARLPACLLWFGAIIPSGPIDAKISCRLTRKVWYDGRADLVVSGIEAQGFLGEPLVNVRFVAVAHPGHALHQLGRSLDLRDLAQHRQLVVRDSALRQSTNAGWLKAEQRWTVGHVSTSLDMLRRGLGFAWIPETRIADELASGQLKPLPLSAGGIREVPVQLIFRDRDRAGPAAHAMAAALKRAVKEVCEQRSIPSNEQP